MVLRAADKGTGTLDIHTDLHSAKVAGLRRTPFAALHVWDAAARLQMRLEATATILTGPDAAVVSAGVPDALRHSYGSQPETGRPIAEALDYARRPDPASFAILRLTMFRRAKLPPRRGYRRPILAPLMFCQTVRCEAAGGGGDEAG